MKQYFISRNISSFCNKVERDLHETLPDYKTVYFPLYSDHNTKSGSFDYDVIAANEQFIHKSMCHEECGSSTWRNSNTVSQEIILKLIKLSSLKMSERDIVLISFNEFFWIVLAMKRLNFEYFNRNIYIKEVCVVFYIKLYI